MKIDLSKLRDENISNISFNGEIKKDLLNIGERKIKFTSPIKYNGIIYRVDDDKLIEVDVTYAYKESCGRCLEHFIGEDQIVLSEKLVHQLDIDEDDEDDYIVYNDDEKLDIKEEIVNMIVLSLPMKPLCSEDCKGLCSNCGANLNQEECDCVVENVDPRFAILKDIRLDD